jgi:F-type H+-transporting ATPase subunit delta
MLDHKVAYRYAKSLLELAEEKSALEEVLKDMQSLTAVCNQNRDFVMMLNNPVIHHDKKFDIVSRIFKGSLHPITGSFYLLMKKNKREKYLPSIAEAFQNLYLSRKGIKKAQLTTSGPVSAAIISDFEVLAKKVSGSEISFSHVVEPGLIGGFQLKIEDKILDKSVKKQIAELRKSFTYNPYIKGI